MRESTISVIFSLTIIGLSFLMAITTANLPDLDPADDILAENILPLPADLIGSESHELDLPRESPALICYDLPVPQVEVREIREGESATFYSLGILNYADYPPELFNRPCSEGQCRITVALTAEDGSAIYGLPIMSPDMFGDHFDFWYEGQIEAAYFTIIDESCDRSVRSSLIHLGRPSHRELPTPGSSLSAPVQLSPADGSTFGHYPRSATLLWSPVEGAATYTVEIDCYHCCATDRWCTDMDRLWRIVPGISGMSYTFDFVGKQPGRWRVWAVKANGEEGPKSGWWTFECAT